MNDVLILLPRQDADALIWVTRHGDAGVLWGAVSEETPPPKGRRVIAVAPGSEITVHAATLPAGSEAQARAAAPFAVEDEIALDVEAVHVALGPRPAPDSQRQVAVVARERMEAWLALLDEAGLSPSQMVPDFLALAPGEHAALVDAGDRILVRLPGDHTLGGFAVERDLAALVIPQTLAEQGVEALEAWVDDLASLGLSGPNEAVRRSPRLTDEALLTRLVEGVSAGVDLNLLQGPYRARRRGSGDGVSFERWRVLAGLGAAAVVTAFIGLAVEAWAYGENARELRARAQLAYARAFPEEGRVANPARRARARLSEGGVGGVFLDLSAVVFESTAPLEQVQIETLRFDAAENSLAFTIIYDAYADVEALKKAVASHGVEIEEGASRRRGARTSGDFTVTAP